MQTPIAFLKQAPLGAALVAALWAPTARAQPQPDQADEAEPPATRTLASPQMELAIEPGVADALSNPQANRTEGGFAQTVKVLFGLNRYLELGPAATFTTLPASSAANAGSGTSWSFGGGVRVMRPHDEAIGRRGLYAISPWVDADVLYVRTGSLDRPGFAIGGGLGVPIDADRKFWIGPYVRYFQILQGDPMGYDNRDAKILNLGISLDVGFGLEHKRAARVEVVPIVAVVEVPVVPVAPVVVVDPDRDGDSVPDRIDNCPDAAGPADNGGCPVYAKLVVKPDRLELNEKISFKWNSAELDATSRPVLDEVAHALKDNAGFTVQVNGNASADGDPAYNQTLSELRAGAVVDYLVDHGIARTRLAAHGLSSSTPTSTNDTAAGRELNRRVEFIIVEKANTP